MRSPSRCFTHCDKLWLATHSTSARGLHRPSVQLTPHTHETARGSPNGSCLNQSHCPEPTLSIPGSHNVQSKSQCKLLCTAREAGPAAESSRIQIDRPQQPCFPRTPQTLKHLISHVPVCPAARRAAGTRSAVAAAHSRGGRLASPVHGAVLPTTQYMAAQCRPPRCRLPPAHRARPVNDVCAHGAACQRGDSQARALQPARGEWACAVAGRAWRAAQHLLGTGERCSAGFSNLRRPFAAPPASR